METFTVGRIKDAISENLRRARGRNGFPRGAAFEDTGMVSRKISGIKKPVEGMLWRYGQRYENAIKKVPFLKRIAEYTYWCLAVRRATSKTSAALSAQETKDVHNAETGRRP